MPMAQTIQTQADILVALIESERADAAAAANEQIRKYQILFNAFREQSLTVHAATKADAQQQLAEMQSRLLGHAKARSSSSSEEPPVEGTSLELPRLEQLKTALNPLGIIVSADDTSPLLRFDPRWNTILTDLGIANLGTFLERLTNRLQHDRETIASLETQLHAANQERSKMMTEDEAKIASLKSEISRLLITSPPSLPIPHSSPPTLYKIPTTEISSALLESRLIHYRPHPVS